MANEKDQKRTILVVDDAPANIQIVSAILQGAYKVRVATSGAKALELVSTTPRPDLILLDVMMPGMDGYEVCTRLKTDPGTRDIPVIFLTGQTETADETHGFEVGAVDYIHKPFSPPVVLARVQTQLNLRDVREQLARETQLALRQSLESRLVEQFGRGLLSCSTSQLVASTAVNQAVDLFGATAAAFDSAVSPGLHRSRPEAWAWSIPESLRKQALERGDWVRDPGSGVIVIPLVLEHAPIAYFDLRGVEVSDTVLTAISSQLKMTLGRVVAGERLLQLAGEIQMGLLPRKLSAGVAEVDVCATIVPTFDVGGDFYQYFLLDPDHLCFVIGDVSDKGIPAALFMAMTITAFVVAAKYGGRTLPEGVRRTLPEGIRLLNRYLCDNNQSQMFVTLYAGILDLQTGMLEYCDGGHEPPFLIRSGHKPQIIQKHPGLALGVDPSYPYQSMNLQLKPGDALFLYTDGVNEARNPEGKFFEADGIEAALASDHLTTCESICNAVMKELGQFVNGAPQSDDIAMLAVSFREREDATVQPAA